MAQDIDRIIEAAKMVDRLRQELAAAEAELRSLTGGAQAKGPEPRTSGRGAFTEQVLAAVDDEVMASDIVKKLGLKKEDRRRVYDVLKKAAGKRGGPIMRTASGAFAPRNPR